MRVVGLGFRGALPPAARFATAPSARPTARLRRTRCRRGFGFQGGLAPRGSLRDRSPCRLRRARSARGTTAVRVVGLGSGGALPPAARFATAPPAAFGGLAPLAGDVGARRGFGSRGALPPAARLRDRSPCRLRGLAPLAAVNRRAPSQVPPKPNLASSQATRTQSALQSRRAGSTVPDTCWRCVRVRAAPLGEDRPTHLESRRAR